MDKDAIDALSTLLEEANVTRNELQDWTLEEFNGKNILFFKGKNYIPQKRRATTRHHTIVSGQPNSRTSRQTRDVQLNLTPLLVAWTTNIRQKLR